MDKAIQAVHKPKARLAVLIRAKTTTVSWPCPPVAGAVGSAWGQAHACLRAGVKGTLCSDDDV